MAAKMGGGNLTAPVQRVPDFLAAQLSTGILPSSSYRFYQRNPFPKTPFCPLYHVTSAVSLDLAHYKKSVGIWTAIVI